MSITDWPANERPRERLLSQGAHALSDAELLAIFLRTGHAGSSAVDVARRLLSRFDGLRGLINCEPDEFLAEPGLGPAKYAQLQAIAELAKRQLKSALARDTCLNNPMATRDYLRAWLRDQPSEVFAGIFLDSRHRVIATEAMFTGTIDRASIHPREVVRRSLQLNAAALILAHNHPSGVAEPSAADRQITDQICQALALVDVRVLDHIVVGDTQTCSFAERGWIGTI